MRKTEKITKNSTLVLLFALTSSCSQNDDTTVPAALSTPDNTAKYTFPSEEEPHEGTWLQWPHSRTYGAEVPKRYDPIWVAMTKALHPGEMVHIVAYNEAEQRRIVRLLNDANVAMDKVDFLIAKTNDVWSRDNGPIFVRNENDQLIITNWQFNAWGNKAPYEADNQIPTLVANAIGMPKIDVEMVLEGGAIEVDGHGTLMATRSAILNTNRNPNLTQEQAESYFTQYLGVTNFIWLDGIAGQDITDYHIDGFARFAPGNVLLTHADEHMLSPGEYEVLTTAKNAAGEAYKRVVLPVALEVEGSYMNYYVGNEVVLVPNYDSPTDAEANAIIQSLFPNRTVVGINVLELWEDGGALHCVTQQQPK